MTHYTLLVDGERKATGQYREVLNPANQDIVGYMPLATVEDLEQAIAAARAAFPGWSALADAERQRLCHAVADKLEANVEELARLLTLEQGKPLHGRGSRGEIMGAIGWVRATADLVLPVEVIHDTPGKRVELHRKPLGVVASITPWNFPVMIACWHMIPAIRTGNTVVVKPSPMTPLATIRLVELMNEVLPKGVVNVVTCADEIGAMLTAHPAIAKVVFTGSTATGRKVMSSAADTLKRLTLELGGNDAGIVLPDADPEAIAAGLFWGAFMNNGQTCAALKRLYVHDSIYEAVCAALVAIAETIVTGNGMDEATILGPVQNKPQFERVKALVEEARAAGARVLIGGNPSEGNGYFYPVTLVADVDHGLRLVDEEQFGPVLPIIRYKDIEEVLAKANSSSYGLGGSVWSRDGEAAKALAMRLECGTAWVNQHGVIKPDAPFGGVKQSGLGVEFGPEGLKEFTTIQTVYA